MVRFLLHSPLLFAFWPFSLLTILIGDVGRAVEEKQTDFRCASSRLPGHEHCAFGLCFDLFDISTEHIVSGCAGTPSLCVSSGCSLMDDHQSFVCCCAHSFCNGKSPNLVRARWRMFRKGDYPMGGGINNGGRMRKSARDLANGGKEDKNGTAIGDGKPAKQKAMMISKDGKGTTATNSTTPMTRTTTKSTMQKAMTNETKTEKMPAQKMENEKEKTKKALTATTAATTTTRPKGKIMDDEEKKSAEGKSEKGRKKDEKTMEGMKRPSAEGNFTKTEAETEVKKAESEKDQKAMENTSGKTEVDKGNVRGKENDRPMMKSIERTAEQQTTKMTTPAEEGIRIRTTPKAATSPHITVKSGKGTTAESSSRATTTKMGRAREEVNSTTTAPKGNQRQKEQMITTTATEKITETTNTKIDNGTVGQSNLMTTNKPRISATQTAAAHRTIVLSTTPPPRDQYDNDPSDEQRRHHSPPSISIQHVSAGQGQHSQQSHHTQSHSPSVPNSAVRSDRTTRSPEGPRKGNRQNGGKEEVMPFFPWYWVALAGFACSSAVFAFVYWSVRGCQRIFHKRRGNGEREGGGGSNDDHPNGGETAMIVANGKRQKKRSNRKRRVMKTEAWEGQEDGAGLAVLKSNKTTTNDSLMSQCTTSTSVMMGEGKGGKPVMERGEEEEYYGGGEQVTVMDPLLNQQWNGTMNK